jgi:murein DD-endopeptidase MepM/ murein hydrolase activator NlpD
MKRIYYTIIGILCFFLLIGNLSAKTLKEVKDELARDEANRNALIQRQKDVQNNIRKSQKEIASLEDDIEKYENEIEDLLEKIDELTENINNKQVEIDNLVNFLEVSDGDNVYLEYIFKSKSFTDFIYRTAVVEQLTKYNDELINEMYEMIEENKRLQNELNDKIDKNEQSIANLEKKLSSYNVSLKDLETAHSNIDDTIADRKRTLKYYESIYKQNNCKETVELDACLTVETASGFIRPTAKGSISSEWGYRRCPIHGRELHSGIDIALPLNTPVYAAASGTVVGITRKSSCGGNIVTIRHSIKGTIYRTRYMHLASINVSMGQKVTVLTVIGKSGGGGYTLKRNGGWDRCSTGAHLHFMILPGSTGSSTINPRKMIKFPSKGKSFKARW